jgi:xylose isomerase
VKVGGKGYVFWGGREGDTRLCNYLVVECERKNRNLMRLVSKIWNVHRLHWRFYIEPSQGTHDAYSSDFDAALPLVSCASLHGQGLKLNFEANHATWPAITFRTI